MVHFRMTPERLPHKVGTYPRVVQGLYEEWTGEGERGGERRVRDTAEERLVDTVYTYTLTLCTVQ